MAAYPSVDEQIDYIRAAALRNGIDPDIAVRVARSEGLKDYVGDNGSSFGPYQLHYGGIASGGNKVSGLGDDFTKSTGLDASDPSTWKQQVDFSLSHAAKNGWTDWHGAARVNIGDQEGIGNTPSKFDDPSNAPTPGVTMQVPMGTSISAMTTGPLGPFTPSQARPTPIIAQNLPLSADTTDSNNAAIMPQPNQLPAAAPYATPGLLSAPSTPAAPMPLAPPGLLSSSQTTAQPAAPAPSGLAGLLSKKDADGKNDASTIVYALTGKSGGTSSQQDQFLTDPSVQQGAAMLQAAQAAQMQRMQMAMQMMPKFNGGLLGA